MFDQLTSNEYNMWKNVLTNDDDVSASDKEGRDVNIYVSDNRTKRKKHNWGRAGFIYSS